MNSVAVLVLCGFGLNCDHETAHAFALVGAHPRRVHINDLIQGAVHLADFQILVFGGGFSWGDDHGAGVIQAVRMKTHLGPQLTAFVAQGGLVLGICNGFQVLVNLGLLPALTGDGQRRRVALMPNECGNFRDQWVHLEINPHAPSVFTRGLTHLELPVRHGEGRFTTDPDTHQRLVAGQQIVLRYARATGEPARNAFPENPNGALDDIAGICDPTGRVLGLMPHPEAYHHPTHHPRWTRTLAQARRDGQPASALPYPDGLRLLANAVDYVRGGR